MTSKAMRDSQQMYPAIHEQWQGSSHIDAMASEAENALKTFAYDGKKEGSNQEKYLVILSTT